ncbi:MAG: hypothetical protein JWL72_4481 [Ilumatobacteraceae bacterium]|nr:hypothetical protein [Ilumatobacteraceae bacterium]MCU1391143.1 hypothetical protein [Ilumatobacteraceae bacterium]
MNTTEWVFRHAGGCLIETPDLPVPHGPQRRAWIATHWREPGTGHWKSFAWTPGERGWQLPQTLAVGDVLEFGADTLDPYGLPIPGSMTRWYGWLHYATNRGIVVYGPFTKAVAAEDAARPLVDELRLAQIGVEMGDWLDGLDIGIAGDSQ